MMDDKRTSVIEGEKQAFDQQILERVANGHVPDLRHPLRNEWFFNNVWRDPEFVEMSFVDNIKFLEKYLKSGSRVLELGCGPGHTSLELARHGHHVTGIDLSPACIRIARETLANNSYQDGFGSLDYQDGDFLKLPLIEGSFDAVLAYGALSHFPELEEVLERVSRLLGPSGQILIWDTSVDQYSLKDASILYLIRALLSATGHYYEKQELPQNRLKLEEELGNVLKELQYLDEKGGKLQSPNDNSQNIQTMRAALSRRFDQVTFEWDSCFFRNMIGGIRAQTPEKERALAGFIKLIDRYLIDQKVLNPAFFYYVGKKRADRDRK